MTSNLPITTLGLQIKAHVTKGDTCADKAEQHYKAAGLHLEEAFQRCRGPDKEMPWLAFLGAHAGLGEARARTLRQIGRGDTTLAEVRAKNATTNKQSRAKATSRDVGLTSDQPSGPPPGYEYVDPKTNPEVFAYTVKLAVDGLLRGDYEIAALGRALRGILTTQQLTDAIGVLEGVKEHVK